MLTKLLSFANIGLDGEIITVEVGSTPGDSGMCIVGLGDTAVHESRQRVRLALRSSGFRIPTGQTTTVNLAPADVKKVGPRYDLPIAIGVLLAHDVIELRPEQFAGTLFLGELALDGSLRHVSGVLPATIACRKHGIRRIVVPAVNGPEAALIPGMEVLAPENITELLAILRGEKLPPHIPPPASSPAREIDMDFADIRGQQHAKRALEIAAAGGHNVLMSGAPGAGKTLLARALKSILPPLTQEESIEVTQVYSIANRLPSDTPLLTERPFRIVHHTASGVSIVGGGQVPGPGEISLAHRGVLFLDELAEFPPHVLEVLRQPLEDRCITITRAQGSFTFPADFLLVAAMNPPKYTTGSPERMRRRVSVPLLDRIDLSIHVQPVPVDDLQKRGEGEPSAMILTRIIAARERQSQRFRSCAFRTNKEMGVRDIEKFCPLNGGSLLLLRQAAERMNLSARGYHRTIKVARTIADLAGRNAIEETHIAEALQYRQATGVE